jgi:hypothetical protein
MKRIFWERKVFGFILLGIAAIALFSFIVMSLWNAILVPVLHISAVSFWQALGILVLSKILFGGFRGRGRWGGGGHHWNQEMKQKWQNMSPEEREQMKQQWRDKCRHWGRKSWNEGMEEKGSDNYRDGN